MHLRKLTVVWAPWYDAGMSSYDAEGRRGRSLTMSGMSCAQVSEDIFEEGAFEERALGSALHSPSQGVPVSIGEPWSYILADNVVAILLHY